jgi:translation elongation factor EF-1alpha
LIQYTHHFDKPIKLPVQEVHQIDCIDTVSIERVESGKMKPRKRSVEIHDKIFGEAIDEKILQF